MPDQPVEPALPAHILQNRASRVPRLENEMRDVKGIFSRLEPLIIRMDAILPHLATKADLAAARGDLSSEIERTEGDLPAEIARTRGDLSTEIATINGSLAIAIAEKPGKTYIWNVLTAPAAAYAAGLAALAMLR